MSAVLTLQSLDARVAAGGARLSAVLTLRSLDARVASGGTR